MSSSNHGSYNEQLLVQYLYVYFPLILLVFSEKVQLMSDLETGLVLLVKDITLVDVLIATSATQLNRRVMTKLQMAWLGRSCVSCIMSSDLLSSTMLSSTLLLHYHTYSPFHTVP